jgi:hypothetical protein
MNDRVGKIFIAQPPLSRCLVCDVLFSRDASRVHSAEICFPVPPACPPFSYGVVLGEA